MAKLKNNCVPFCVCLYPGVRYRVGGGVTNLFEWQKLTLQYYRLCPPPHIPRR